MISDRRLLDRYFGALDDLAAHRSEFMSLGKCEDMTKYTQLCGEILGIRIAKQVLIDLLKTQDPDGDPIA